MKIKDELPVHHVVEKCFSHLDTNAGEGCCA